LLHPHRDPTRVRDGFPCFVPDPNTDSAGRSPAAAVISVTELLRTACERAFTGGDGKTLADNLDRLELAIRRDVAGKPSPTDAGETLELAGTTMLAGLGLPKGAVAEAQESFRRLLGAVPSGRFVACNAATPLHLLAFAKAHASDARFRAARHELEELHDRLASRLDVDDTKRTQGRTSDAVGRSLGAATGQLLQPEAVVSLLGRVRGAIPMAPERRTRVEGALGVIRRFIDSHVETRTTLVVARGGERRVDARTFDVVIADDPLAAAHDRALESAAAVLGVCRAVRLARLELDGRYDPARHEEWLRALSSEMLDDDERALLPPIVVLVESERIESTWLSGLSRVLRSPWPVAVLSVTAPLGALGPDLGIDVGYFGIGHRGAFVQQSSVSRPAHLYDGFVRALGASRPSLHVIDLGETSEGEEPAIGRWLRAGAAIEGRAHPLFRFDPAAGEDFASRFDLDENPELESPWSAAAITAAGAGGDAVSLSTTFTFADLALLDPALAPELAPAPHGPSEALVTVDRYLDMTGDERAGRIPYVWAAHASGRLQRIAVTARLCRASAERRDFWHTLQELCGVRSTYVERAEARVREHMEAEATDRRRRVDAEHVEALERARTEAASEALDGLARYLLDMGGDFTTSSGSAASPSAARVPAAAPTATPDAIIPAPAVVTAEPTLVPGDAAEPSGFEDPWIETALCTSCNDCTNINPKLFVYDGNKQAHIGDPDAGTFAQLVAAAEKCPARCIHPGKPRNPSEPNLEELVRRAVQFNT
jgi:ferredoxin